MTEKTGIIHPPLRNEFGTHMHRLKFEIVTVLEEVATQNKIVFAMPDTWLHRPVQLHF